MPKSMVSLSRTTRRPPDRYTPPRTQGVAKKETARGSDRDQKKKKVAVASKKPSPRQIVEESDLESSDILVYEHLVAEDKEEYYNKTLYDLCQSNCKAYNAAPYPGEERRAIIKSIIDGVGGRFLRAEDDSLEMWHVMDETETRTYVQTRMRKYHSEAQKKQKAAEATTSGGKKAKTHKARGLVTPTTAAASSDAAARRNSTSSTGSNSTSHNKRWTIDNKRVKMEDGADDEEEVDEGEDAWTMTTEQCVASIRFWLRGVYGEGAVTADMHDYATRFVELGLHSVSVIRQFCTAADVDGFEWMKPFHKRVFEARAQLENP